jgi:CubicO group peptidase (beta-lactamase class C family)
MRRLLAIPFFKIALVCTLVLVYDGAAFGQTNCANWLLNTQDKHPHNVAEPAAVPFSLRTASTPLGQISYKVRNAPGQFTLDEYLAKFCTTGLLIMKGDEVVFERYLQNRKPADKLLSASVSKTILAILTGIAIDEAKLRLEDRVAAILPDFKESAFAEDTVEDLLRMSSGAALVHSHDRDVASDNRMINPLIRPDQDVRQYLQQKTKKVGKAGAVFAYNGAQSAVLGLMLAERVGKSLTRYLETKIWKLIAEDRGYWIKNRDGVESVAGHFVATLRDYARLGYLLMNRGQINGKSVVPASWIDKMVEVRSDKPQPANPPHYGLHIWIPQAANGRSFFWGTNGQNIFVDPIARVVIVHTGNSPGAAFDGNSHLFALRDAIMRHLTTSRRR